MRVIRDWNPAVHNPLQAGDVVWNDDSNGTGWLVYLERDGLIDGFAPAPEYYHDDLNISEEHAEDMLRATAAWESVEL